MCVDHDLSHNNMAKHISHHHTHSSRVCVQMQNWSVGNWLLAALQKQQLQHVVYTHGLYYCSIIMWLNVCLNSHYMCRMCVCVCVSTYEDIGRSYMDSCSSHGYEISHFKCADDGLR